MNSFNGQVILQANQTNRESDDHCFAGSRTPVCRKSNTSTRWRERRGGAGWRAFSLLLPPSLRLLGSCIRQQSSPFTNTLGMKFIPVKDTDVLFCIHETRRQDYEAFAKEMPAVDASWKKPAQGGSADVEGDDHPVVHVNWDDAQAFCDWLSKKEGRAYRLPADREWSHAIGIERDEKRSKEDTPKTLSSRAGPGWVWGTQCLPPPKGSGNFFDLTQMATVPNFEIPLQTETFYIMIMMMDM